MKKIQSKVLAALAAAAILIPTVSVYAEGTSNTESKIMNSINRQQQRIENVKQRQDTKADLSEKKSILTEKKDLIKQLHETNSSLRKEIAGKRTSVKSIYKEIVENHKLLNPEDLSKIQAQLQTVETQVSALADTKGTIKSEFQEVRTSLKDKNFDEAQADLDNVVSIQNTRTEGLKKLNSQMDDLLNILKSASANATK